jgi:hypothetical protein
MRKPARAISGRVAIMQSGEIFQDLKITHGRKSQIHKLVKYIFFIFSNNEHEKYFLHQPKNWNWKILWSVKTSSSLKKIC